MTTDLNLDEFAAWKWLANYASDRVAEMKGGIAKAMNENDDVKKTVRIGGTKVADVTVPAIKEKTTVTNEAAFIAWAIENVPGLVEVVTIPARVEQRLIGRRVADYLAALERGADPETGVIPDGVTYVPEKPASWPTVHFAKDAGETILGSLTSGALPLFGELRSIEAAS